MMVVENGCAEVFCQNICNYHARLLYQTREIMPAYQIREIRDAYI